MRREGELSCEAIVAGRSVGDFLDLRYVLLKTSPWSPNPPSSVLRGLRVFEGMIRGQSALADYLRVSPTQIQAWLSDIRRSPSHRDEVSETWRIATGSQLPNRPGSLGTLNLVLYLLVRHFKPRVAIETGVEYGFSSSFILRGLEDNGFGELWSIDLPTTSERGRVNTDGRLDPAHVDNKSSTGRAIPMRLRGRWHLVIAPSNPALKNLLNRMPEIDLFFHDSDHSTSNMLWEFRTAWPCLSRGGVLVADDVDWNDAFPSFSREVGASGFRWWGKQGARGLIVRP